MGELKTMPGWPARMSEERASAYLSVSRSTFRSRVANHEYPQPVREGGRIYWSKIQLDTHIAMQFGHHVVSVLEDPTWADLR